MLGNKFRIFTSGMLVAAIAACSSGPAESPAPVVTGASQAAPVQPPGNPAIPPNPCEVLSLEKTRELTGWSDLSTVINDGTELTKFKDGTASLGCIYEKPKERAVLLLLNAGPIKAIESNWAAYATTDLTPGIGEKGAVVSEGAATFYRVKPGDPEFGYIVTLSMTGVKTAASREITLRVVKYLDSRLTG